VRLALIEAGHWHVPLVLPGLNDEGAIVAVSDENEATAKTLAAGFGARAYPSAEALIDEAAFDFAFVFGRHRCMPALARRLIARRSPFSLEKPGGVSATDVEDVLAAAEAQSVWVSVPFVNRLAPWRERLDALRPGPVLRASISDIAGSPTRYRDAGCGWMLDASEAGGGCLINLGIHFLDLAAERAASPLTLEGAVVSNAVHGEAVEDQADLLLQDATGGSWHISVGYGFPTAAGRHQAYRFAGRGWHMAIEGGRLAFTTGAGTVEEPAAVDAAPLMATYVRETLQRWRQSRPPLAGLADLVRAMQLVDAAYRHARRAL